MWSLRVELVGPDGKATLANEYNYALTDIATRYALDVCELLAESDHVLDLEPLETA
jgi:hypothetical protein